MQNRLFVAYKPAGISSNNFSKDIKRKFGVKKAGYSGTLDPFAKGVLIFAFGQFTKLFRFLDKTPKVYQAKLHLGAYSKTLDSEAIEEVKEIEQIDIKRIDDILNSLKGEIEYLPPKFCAKSIDGQRAYKLAREGKEFELKKIKSKIFDIKILNYTHPFLNFEIAVSEGAYIRSIGALIAQKLGTVGALTSLERVREGNFIYEDERELNPLEYLKTEENSYLRDKNDILLGKKLLKDDFEKNEDGVYHIVIDNMLSVINIDDGKVSYELNRIRMQGC